MSEGFLLNPHKIVEEIHRAIDNDDGWTLSVFLDGFTHPDFNGGGHMVTDPVDRAVVVFVGSRAQAEAAAVAVRESQEAS